MMVQSQAQIVDYKELGVRFKIPSGWTSQIDGDYMFLKHASMSGLIVVFESRSKSVNELITLANNGIVDEGVHLNSLNNFKVTTENRVEGHYEGIFMSTIVKGYAIGIVNGFGSGISILALSEPKHFNKALETEAQKLANSVKFEKVKPSKETRFWSKRLVGMRLKYFDTDTSHDFNGVISSGISDREILDLFNDGSFYYYVNNQSLINTGTIREGDNLSGEYRIITLGDSIYLQLFFKNDSLEFKLTVNDRNNTLLNGRRYLIDDLED